MIEYKYSFKDKFKIKEFKKRRCDHIGSKKEENSIDKASRLVEIMGNK
jgi:hypothetical protein